MAAEDSTELLPVMGGGEPSFGNAMRGYDKHEVDTYVSRLEADLLDLRADRDMALVVSADRAAQLAGQQAEIASLQNVLAQSAAKIDSTNVAHRVAESLDAAQREAAALLEMAQDEARRITAAAQAQASNALELARLECTRALGGAQAEAALVIEHAETEAARITEEARTDTERQRLEAAADVERASTVASQRTAEAEQRLVQAKMQAVAELGAAQNEAGSLLALATDERERLDAAALAARTAADEESANSRHEAEQDFEITLRLRRRTAEQEATAALTETRNTVAHLLAEAQLRVDELQGHRERLHSELVSLHERVAAVIAQTEP